MTALPRVRLVVGFAVLTLAAGYLVQVVDGRALTEVARAVLTETPRSVRRARRLRRRVRPALVGVAGHPAWARVRSVLGCPARQPAG
ncbi:MAG TPA: hypothetical protein VGO16_11660 [Pseudonocardiaceae bacterium]|jgi:hypothetical protein|nr:hypothetical protein [Pseudonocardiaceae bacterium]